MGRFGTGNKVSNNGWITKNSSKKIVETMARFVRGKKFETWDGFPTIPVRKILETMARFVKGKSLKQRRDFQQSQCKNALKLWLDLEEERTFETTDGFPTILV